MSSAVGGTGGASGMPSGTAGMAEAGAPRPRSQRQQETCRRILLAAAAVFAERGFTGASMDEVAERAGVGKGTIFYNFGAKQALFEQLILQASGRLGDAIAGARDGRRGWAALETSAIEIMRVVGENPGTTGLVNGELFRSGRPWTDTLAAARETLLAPMRLTIAELAHDRVAAGAASAIPDQAQVDTVAIAALGALVTSALDRSLYAPDRPVEDVVAALMLALSGLRP